MPTRALSYGHESNGLAHHAPTIDWLDHELGRGARVVGTELADDATRLADLPAARQRTIAVLGHEQTGIPPEALDLLDEVVEIPMVGTGHRALDAAADARGDSHL